jgi:hypothetical protein
VANLQKSLMLRPPGADSSSMTVMQQPLVAEEPQVGDSFVVACIRCGATRTTERLESGHLTSPVCQWCGDSGWSEAHAAASPEVAELARHHSR